MVTDSQTPNLEMLLHLKKKKHLHISFGSCTTSFSGVNRQLITGRVKIELNILKVRFYIISIDTHFRCFGQCEIDKKNYVSNYFLIDAVNCL